MSGTYKELLIQRNENTMQPVYIHMYIWSNQMFMNEWMNEWQCIHTAAYHIAGESHQSYMHQYGPISETSHWAKTKANCEKVYIT